MILFWLAQYPRRVLLSDVHRAKRIIVKWSVPDGNHTIRPVAFELDEDTRSRWEQGLNENLGLDYFRTQATVTPIIGVYLTDENNDFLGYYGIRLDRGGGRSPAMESLRTIASQAKPLSRIEADTIFDNDTLRSSWPHILPWPECRYDFVLPVVPAAVDPLWEELHREPPPDARLRQTLKGHTGKLLCLAYSPDGKTLATGSWDKMIKLWNVTDGRTIASLTGHRDEIRSLAFSPDGKTSASAGGNDSTIGLWDVVTKQHIGTLKGYTGIVETVAYGHDGRILASAGWGEPTKL
jgi:hypothetical protein